MKFFNAYDERIVIAMSFLLIVLTEKSKKLQYTTPPM